MLCNLKSAIYYSGFRQKVFRPLLGFVHCTLYCRSTFGFEFSWVRLCKLCTPGSGQLFPFFLTDPLSVSQIKWGVFMTYHLQVSAQIFYGVQIWGLAGLFKDVHRFVSKPHQHCLSYMLWVVLMLKGEILPHSEVVCTQVFSKVLSIFGSIHPSLNSDQSPRLSH